MADVKKTEAALDPDAVMQEELAYVLCRRGCSDAVKVADDLIGIAFSGGGIRSATFGLGVLEGLKKHKLLDRIDYLSTVSGGGYIGAWLSANCRRDAERRGAAAGASKAPAAKPIAGSDEPLERFPAMPQEAEAGCARQSKESEACAIGEERAAKQKREASGWLRAEAKWDDSIAHLRRYSNYLSPELGFFSADTWSMATIWLRNAMLVQATVVFALAFLLLLPRILHEVFDGWHDTGHWRYATVVIFIVAVVGIAGNLWRLSRDGSDFVLEGRNWIPSSAASAVLFAIACFLVGYWNFEPFTYESVALGQGFCIALLAVASGFFLLPLGVKVAGLFIKRTDRRPTQVNYTQAWVQGAVVLPLLATGFLIAAVLWGQTLYSPHFKDVATYGGFLAKEWRYWPFPLQIALVALLLLSICSLCVQRGNPEIEGTSGSHKRGWHRRILLVVFAPLPAVVVLYLALCGILLLLQDWATEAHRGPWLALIWAPALVLFSFSLAIVVLIGMMGRRSRESIREWWSRLGAWLCIYGIAWLVISVAAVFGPKLAAAMLDGDFWHSLSAVGGWVATTLGGLFAANSGSTGKTVEDDAGKKSKADMMKELLAAIGPFVFIFGLLVFVSTVLHLIVLSFSSLLADWTLGNLARPHWLYMSAPTIDIVFLACGASAAIAMLLSRRVDINVFNLNAFYRNRLNRCYLGAARFLPGERTPQNFTGLDDNDDFPISELWTDTPAGPFHIVNCALNLGGSSDLSLHTRHSASFIITPGATGSGYIALDSKGNRSPVGYRRTAGYGGEPGYPTLGQAMSVSGAAASPNMGYHTSPTISFLLTMFNARLGWWFPNPRAPSGRPSPRHSLSYLVKELFGVADDKSSFLNVSDGGHFENLAVYELIRRKCKVIIASDAECDPKLQCEGLARLIRMCAVDFDAVIDIDASAIRLAAGSAWSRNRCAVGTIKYGASTAAPQTGTLIYLKASMTGHEDTAVLQYKATHPAFPHESTGNQFYGEDQFESYRNLGKDITERVFEHVALDAKGSPRAWTRIADDLKAIMAPTLSTLTQFTGHGKTLMNLWSRLAASPELKLLEETDQRTIDNAWPDGTLPKAYRPVYYVCNQIVQLMENVYLDLDLEKTWEHVDNRGWRATFRNWAGLPAVRKTWAMNGATFGLRFQHFCNRNLDLPMP